jgi:hypothetical protein
MIEGLRRYFREENDRHHGFRGIEESNRLVMKVATAASLLH